MVLTAPRPASINTILSALSVIDDPEKRMEILQSICNEIEVPSVPPPQPPETIENSMGPPNEEQLALINSFRPDGQAPYSADEIFVVRMRASHNLLSFDRYAWSPQALRLMAEDYPGAQHILDHRSYDSDRVIGFVYKAELIRSPDAGPEDVDYLDYKEINQGIIDQDGFIELVLECAVERGTMVERNFRFRRYSQVSTGGYHFQENLCPNCNTSFKHEECPHIPPTSWVMYLLREGYLEPDEVALIAPYIRRHSNKTKMIEVSQVPMGNLVTTKVIGT